MRVVALISGGKDSTYNLCKCVDSGHEIVSLANLFPPNPEKSGDEMDSFMYQTVGHSAIETYAQVLRIPLYRRAITGRPVKQSLDYEEESGDEVEDLFQLLLTIGDSGCAFDAISVGAIHSIYQKKRAENVCNRLGIQMLAYLWGREQEQLLQEMIDYGIVAVLIKTAALGLNKDHIGKELSEVKDHLTQLKDKYGINTCGEGGEFETLTLDCPLFHQRLRIKSYEVIVHSNDAFAPVCYMSKIEIDFQDK